MDYSILFTNNSPNSGSVCIYQTIDATANNAEIIPLAWLCKNVHPTTQVHFTWKLNYNFIWSRTKDLKNGTTLKTSQIWDVNLELNNSVELNYIEEAYTFQNLHEGGETGKFYIHQGPKLPYQKSTVGLGVSGKGIFAIPTQPNTSIVLTHQPKYWITFGYFKEGQALNLSEITNKSEIEFPINIYSMAATLRGDNTWSITTNI